jgi:hypothetical protein
MFLFLSFPVSLLFLPVPLNKVPHRKPIDSVLVKHLNIRDGSISTSVSVKYSAKPVVMPCLVHCSQHSLNSCLSGTTTGIPGGPALDFVEFFPPSHFLRTSCFESHSTLSFSPCISFYRIQETQVPYTTVVRRFVGERVQRRWLSYGTTQWISSGLFDLSVNVL